MNEIIVILFSYLAIIRMVNIYSPQLLCESTVLTNESSRGSINSISVLIHQVNFKKDILPGAQIPNQNERMKIQIQNLIKQRELIK